jgi:uncharacterized protein (TIGR02246 family)
MSNLHGSTIATLALVAAAIAVPRDAAGQLSEPTAAEVRAIWQAIDEAWNARDVDAFSVLFTDDALFAFMNNDDRMETRSAIHARFSRQFPAMPAELRHITHVRAVRTITPDIRSADGHIDILQVANAGKSEATVFRSFAMTAVMQRTPEGWRIRELHVHPRG